MLSFLVYLIVIFLAARLFFRFAFPYILRYFLRRYARHVEEKILNHENRFQDMYNPEFDQELHVSRDMTIRKPREADGGKRRSQIDDVPFEDIKP